MFLCDYVYPVGMAAYALMTYLCVNMRVHVHVCVSVRACACVFLLYAPVCVLAFSPLASLSWHRDGKPLPITDDTFGNMESIQVGDAKRITVCM